MGNGTFTCVEEDVNADLSSALVQRGRKTILNFDITYTHKHLKTMRHSFAWRSYLCVQFWRCGQRLTGPRACRAVWCGEGWR